MTENKHMISIINIRNTEINDSADTIISMRGLEKIPLNKAIDLVKYLYKFNHVIVKDMNSEIRDIMDLTNRIIN